MDMQRISINNGEIYEFGSLKLNIFDKKIFDIRIGEISKDNITRIEMDGYEYKVFVNDKGDEPRLIVNGPRNTSFGIIIYYMVENLISGKYSEESLVVMTSDENERIMLDTVLLDIFDNKTIEDTLDEIGRCDSELHNIKVYYENNPFRFSDIKLSIHKAMAKIRYNCDKVGAFYNQGEEERDIINSVMADVFGIDEDEEKDYSELYDYINDNLVAKELDLDEVSTEVGKMIFKDIVDSKIDWN